LAAVKSSSVIILNFRINAGVLWTKKKGKYPTLFWEEVFDAELGAFDKNSISIYKI